jgi:hypothetical protein
LEWRKSREFFYWRLKRRLGENNAIKTILSAETSMEYQLGYNYLQQWFYEDKNNDVKTVFFSNDFKRNFFSLDFTMGKR